jgi:serine/alanine adding enzyme
MMAHGPRSVSGLRVTEVGDRWSQWDSFVTRSPQSTFAHRAAWHRVVADVFHHRHAFLVAEDDAGEWHGVLPLVHLRGVLGHFILSMPFLNDGGPIGEENARTELAAKAVHLASESRANTLELRSRVAIPASGALTTTSRKVAVYLRLPASIELLWEKTFKAKLRSQIRKPTKEGMIARIGRAELDPFYRVFCRNMRDLGTPVLPKGFFETIAREFGDDVVFCTVYAGSGVPAAAACCLVWRDEMEITWASSVREFNPLSPNMLLYATLMEDAIQRGLGVFNFGRSTPGGPTHRFKTQWGGQDIPLPWARWSSSGGTDDDERHGRVIRAAVTLWSKLPLALTNRVGPMISGQLPW